MRRQNWSTRLNLTKYKMESRQSKDHRLFNRIAGDYARKDVVQSTAFVRKHRLIKSVDFLLNEEKSLGTILDIGCGVGAPSWFLEGHYDTYIGIDRSEKLIEQAELHKKSSSVRFVVADLTNMEIDANADVVLAVGVLHHITELDAVMTSIKGVAKPGAYFVAFEPHCMNPIAQLLRRIRKNIDTPYSEDQRFFKPSELVDLLERNGFEDISYQFHGFVSTPFGEVILRPQWLFSRISKAAVFIDSMLDKILPNSLKFLSWSIIVRAKFPRTQ